MLSALTLFAKVKFKRKMLYFWLPLVTCMCVGLGKTSARCYINPLFPMYMHKLSHVDEKP